MFIDNMVCEFMHILCVKFGFFFTPLFRFISILGEKCWLGVLIAFLLCFRKKSRWVGATILSSIAFGWIFADYVFKPIFMRVRPYMSDITKYYQYFLDAGGYEETGYSMPSGHTIGVAAFFTVLLITCKRESRKKVMCIGLICIILMTFARCYFMHHYFTDCLVGVIIAIVMSIIMKLVVKCIYRFIKANEEFGLFNFALNFDIADLFAKKK